MKISLIKMKSLIINVGIIIFLRGLTAKQDEGNQIAKNLNASSIQTIDHFASSIVDSYRSALAAIDYNIMLRKVDNFTLDSSPVNVTYKSENFSVWLNNFTLWEMNSISLTFTCNSSKQSNLTIKYYSKSYLKAYTEYSIKSHETLEIINGSITASPYNSYYNKIPKHINVLHSATKKLSNLHLWLPLIDDIDLKERKVELDNRHKKHYTELSVSACSQIANLNLLQKIAITKTNENISSVINSSDSDVHSIEIEPKENLVDFKLEIQSELNHLYLIKINDVEIRGQYQNNDFRYIVDYIKIMISIWSRKGEQDHVITERKTQIQLHNSTLDNDAISQKVFRTVETELKNSIERELKKFFK